MNSRGIFVFLCINVWTSWKLVECAPTLDLCQSMLWHFPDHCDFPCIPSKDTTCEETYSDESPQEVDYDICKDCYYESDELLEALDPVDDRTNTTLSPTPEKTTPKTATELPIPKRTTLKTATELPIPKWTTTEINNPIAFTRKSAIMDSPFDTESRKGNWTSLAVESTTVHNQEVPPISSTATTPLTSNKTIEPLVTNKVTTFASNDSSTALANKEAMTASSLESDKTTSSSSESNTEKTPSSSSDSNNATTPLFTHETTTLASYELSMSTANNEAITVGNEATLSLVSNKATAPSTDNGKILASNDTTLLSNGPTPSTNSEQSTPLANHATRISFSTNRTMTPSLFSSGEMTPMTQDEDVKPEPKNATATSLASDEATTAAVGDKAEESSANNVTTSLSVNNDEVVSSVYNDATTVPSSNGTARLLTSNEANMTLLENEMPSNERTTQSTNNEAAMTSTNNEATTSLQNTDETITQSSSNEAIAQSLSNEAPTPPPSKEATTTVNLDTIFTTNILTLKDIVTTIIPSTETSDAGPKTSSTKTTTDISNEILHTETMLGVEFTSTALPKRTNSTLTANETQTSNSIQWENIEDNQTTLVGSIGSPITEETVNFLNEVEKGPLTPVSSSDERAQLIVPYNENENLVPTSSPLDDSHGTEAGVTEATIQTTNVETTQMTSLDNMNDASSNNSSSTERSLLGEYENSSMEATDDRSNLVTRSAPINTNDTTNREETLEGPPNQSNGSATDMNVTESIASNASIGGDISVELPPINDILFFEPANVTLLSPKDNETSEAGNYTTEATSTKLPKKPLYVDDLNCTEAPTTYRKKVVKVYRQTVMTWHHALNVCYQNGLQLMSVQNSGDLDSIRETLQTKQYAIGTYILDVGGFRLVGAKDFCWLEGGIVQQKIEPAILDTNRTVCLSVKFSDGYESVKFLQDYCEGPNQLMHMYFLCEKYA